MAQWKIWLVVANGPNEGDTIPISSEQFLIGRQASCHFRPVGEGVADLHCALLVREGRFFLRNFRKPDGTSVGGRQVLGGIELRDGDRFQVGDWQLQARIARRTSPIVEPVLSETETSAAPVPAVLCDVGWSVTSASCPGETAQFFVTCTNVLPAEGLPTSAELSPVASDARLPATGRETESAAGENSEGYADLTEGELPTLPLVEESAPETVAEETSSLPAAGGETEAAPAANLAVHGAGTETVEVEATPAPDTIVESAPETVAGLVTPEETAYRTLAALDAEAGTDAPVTPTPPPPRYSSHQSPIETGRPKKSALDEGPKGRRLLVARLDRAMPTLRQQEWQEATRPKPVPAPPPPRKTWRNWLPVLAGVVVGIVLLGGGFYLAASRASSPASRRDPPRGVIHTGIKIIQQQAPSDPDAVEQQSRPRANVPQRSDGGRVPPRGLPPAQRPHQ